MARPDEKGPGSGSRWIKSSLSFSNGNCVEVANLFDGGVAVRNSRHPEGPVLRFTPGRIEIVPFNVGLHCGMREPFAILEFPIRKTAMCFSRRAQGTPALVMMRSARSPATVKYSSN